MNNPTPQHQQAQIWHGCYDHGWTGVITPESFKHPAKFSKALIERIYDHCLARGWLVRGDTVGDPFGGIATGGIVAAYRGLQWVGVELEAEFVRLGRENIALHDYRLKQIGSPLPVLLQGDSRRFDEIVGQVHAVCCSPPYATSDQNYAAGWKYIDPSKSVHNRYSKQREASYGHTSGQIAGLSEGSVEAVVNCVDLAGDNCNNATYASKITSSRRTNQKSLSVGEKLESDSRSAALRRGVNSEGVENNGNCQNQLGISEAIISERKARRSISSG